MHTIRAADQSAAASEVYDMTLRSRFLSRVFAFSVVLALGALAGELTRTPAQQPKGQERLPFEDKDYRPKDVKAIFQGEQPTDKKLLDAAAKYYAYRLTLSELQSKKDAMQGLVRDASNELDANRKEDRKNTEAIQYFNEQLLARLKEVLPNPRPIASINAARVLVKMASLGQEEVADVLVDTLKDADINDGTKFYAARGLKEFFSLAFPAPEGQAVYFKDRDREARAISTLLAALDRKPPQSPPPTAEEIEGLRVLRREVIRALAMSRYPAAVDAKGAVQGKTALALAKIVRNDNMNPPPRLDEQVEAAIGLALLKQKPNKDFKLANDYQMDVAAHHLGRFIVDFARRNQNRKAEEKTAQHHPWKTSAARLTVALTTLRAEALAFKKADPPKNDKVADFVIKVVDSSLPVLRAVEVEGAPAPDRLAESLDTGKLDDAPVYKGDKDAVVKAGTATLTTEQPKEEKPADEEKK